MILDKTNLITYDQKAIGYVVTELFSTIPFCMAAVGAKEQEEGALTVAAAFTNYVTGDNTHLLPGAGAASPTGLKPVLALRV